MSLKTLKDFEKEDINFVDKTCQKLVIKKIKKEASKWIDNKRTLRMNANDFILVFFNLTEEDLEYTK